MNEPYFVEVETNPCPHCHKGRTWTIIGPDGGCAVGKSWDSDSGDDCPEEAEVICEALNSAYATGQERIEKLESALKALCAWSDHSQLTGVPHGSCIPQVVPSFDETVDMIHALIGAPLPGVGYPPDKPDVLDHLVGDGTPGSGTTNLLFEDRPIPPHKTGPASYYPPAETQPCFMCMGHGVTVSGHASAPKMKECSRCHGSGQLPYTTGGE